MLNREEGKRENFKRKRRKEVRKNIGRQKDTLLILGRAKSKHIFHTVVTFLYNKV
jgi:hypothetical protein